MKITTTQGSQRVAIGRAGTDQMPVVLADEPTGNLDSAASACARLSPTQALSSI